MTELDKWKAADACSGSSVRVQHEETGEIGYRDVTYEGGFPRLKGPVYSGAGHAGKILCGEKASHRWNDPESGNW